MAPQRRISRAQFLSYLNKLKQGQPVPEKRLKQAAHQFGLAIIPLLDRAKRQHVKRDLVIFTSIDPTVITEWQAAVSTCCDDTCFLNRLAASSRR